MGKITDVFAAIFGSLLLVWVGALIFSAEPCDRVHKAAWPVTFSFGVVELLTRNWTTPETKFILLDWKASSAVGVQMFFEQTVYGDVLQCAK